MTDIKVGDKVWWTSVLGYTFAGTVTHVEPEVEIYWVEEDDGDPWCLDGHELTLEETTP